MVWLYEALELKGADGGPSGRYRVCKTSDEDGGGPYGLCDCEGGHESQDAARACPIAKAKLDVAFPSLPPGEAILAEVGAELEAAMSQHGPMRSAHEAYAVIKEELDEVWDEVRSNKQGRNARLLRIREELIQTAAMCVRAIVDLGL